MTDADLIYNALLRAERRIEDRELELHREGHTAAAHHVQSTRNALQCLREEIGNAMSKQSR